MSKTTKVVIGIIVLILIIVGVWISNEKPIVTNTSPITIGYIGPITGGAAILGEEAKSAIEVAVDKVNAKGGINGRTVKLIAEDDQFATAKSVSAYEKLVNIDGVETIIMSNYGGVMAVAEKAKKDNVMIIDSLDCDKDLGALGNNIFCIAKETTDLADVIADYAIEKGYKNIGIIHSTTDNFMQSVSDAFVARIGSKGIVQVESYTPKTIDFKTELLRLKNNDVIVFLGYDEIGVAMKQAKDLGMKQPYLTIPTVATTPSIQELSKGAIEGIIFSFYAPLDTNPVATKYYSDYKAKFGHTPYVYVASDQAYDSAMVLFEKVLPGVNASTKEARLAQGINLMQKVSGYKGVTGNLTMKADGRMGGILIRLFKLVNMIPVYIGK
jgi:branched-chain amino acid transport system substrate-binding protein